SVPSARGIAAPAAEANRQNRANRSPAAQIAPGIARAISSLTPAIPAAVIGAVQVHGVVSRVPVPEGLTQRVAPRCLGAPRMRQSQRANCCVLTPTAPRHAVTVANCLLNCPLRDGRLVEQGPRTAHGILQGSQVRW